MVIFGGARIPAPEHKDRARTPGMAELSKYYDEAYKLARMVSEKGIIERGQTIQAKVFGQMESYDPATDTWQRHAPMPTPRHAVAAVSIGDWIHVAGGGAVLGGAVQSAIHEAWTLG